MKNTIKILDDNSVKYKITDDKIYLNDEILVLSDKKLEGVLDVSMIENLIILLCDENSLKK
jgi:hypothetical protein